ncbi:low temperature requirement protein A [Micromonospora acroterricola]|uniref:Low temperature requirement protein A n=1 Tax=Micromonospora acroterricola TaxID=2202421 RepID=A0A317D8L3_9ACTN|nr:low temperature requirement protein A [Micromonospora acroterricola]PWR11198.1 low temperature requirement protein A [Micromonospora acroterricola]
MTAGRGAGSAVPGRRSPAHPAFLELFFDLVYVFALITLTDKLATELTWTGAAETLVLLLGFTFIWALTAWGGDTLDRARPALQVQVIGTLAASLLLAATVPDAYGSRGLLFAVTYVAIHLGSSVYILLVVRMPSPRRRNSRVLFWEAIAGIGWIGGALVDGTARLMLWAVAVAIEYAAAALGWPVPRLGRLHAEEWRLAGERLSERYRQFVIIALGVSIFSTADTFSESDYTAPRVWALVVVFLMVVLMWRIYIYRAGELLTDAIAKSTRPSLLGQSAAVTHLIMVAGIGGAAVTSTLVVDRPFGETPPSWAAVILGGPALFLFGRGVLDYTVFGRVSRSRLAGLILLGAVASVTYRLPPLAVALLAMVVLALVAAANLLSTRVHPRTAAPPALR